MVGELISSPFFFCVARASVVWLQAPDRFVDSDDQLPAWVRRLRPRTTSLATVCIDWLHNLFPPVPARNKDLRMTSVIIHGL
jgi:hypothetical protein